MSYEAPIVVDGVDYGDRLPRGRHKLPQEVVTANQRERLLRAAVALFTEKGYASLTVADLVDRAGVSRGTFYEIFEDKPACVLAAHQRAFDRLFDAIEEACASEREWPLGVAAAVGTVLDFTAQSPAEVRLILASSQSPSEPELAREGTALHQRLIELLREGSQRSPGLGTPSSVSERAAVGAAMSIVSTSLAAEEIEALPEYKPDLVQIILTPYLGGNEAKRVAQGV